MSDNWFGFIPRRGSGLILFCIIVVVAFAAGFLLRGTGDVTPRDHVKISSGHDHEESGETLWTCSMHPQIQLSKPGKCPICFMDLIPVETEAAGKDVSGRRLKMTNAAMKLAEIRTTPVERRFVETEIRLTGVVAYDETGIADITSWISGRIEHLYVNYTGFTVNKGKPLVDIYSPMLFSTQEELIQARKAIDSLRETPNSVISGSSIATLEASREKLRLYGLTRSQIAKIEDSGKASDRLTILSPAGGTVIDLKASEGMYVKTGTRLFRIADLSTVWVNLTAYQADIPWIVEGQNVEFSSHVFPGKVFKGKVAFIDPVLNSRTRTFVVRVEAGNKNGRFKPGMFVNGTIRASLDAEGMVIGHGDGRGSGAPLVIPATAPLLTGKRAVVYVRIPSTEQPIFEGREVSLGPRAGDYYIVDSGLEEGELVVTNGGFKIDSELQIRARPSMMSPDGSPGKSIHDHGSASGMKEETIRE